MKRKVHFLTEQNEIVCSARGYLHSTRKLDRVTCRRCKVMLEQQRQAESEMSMFGRGTQ